MWMFSTKQNTAAVGWRSLKIRKTGRGILTLMCTAKLRSVSHHTNSFNKLNAKNNIPTKWRNTTYLRFTIQNWKNRYEFINRTQKITSKQNTLAYNTNRIRNSTFFLNAVNTKFETRARRSNAKMELVWLELPSGRVIGWGELKRWNRPMGVFGGVEGYRLLLVGV